MPDSDDYYAGFANAIFWSTANAPIHFNEPDYLVGLDDEYDWDRRRFFEIFAELDDMGIFYWEALPGPSYKVYCTEQFSYEVPDNLPTAHTILQEGSHA